MLWKVLRWVALLGLPAMLWGCMARLWGQSEFRVWKEEVKLNDGRVIVVTQKKRCQRAYTGGNYVPCIAHEAWLTINLPEFGRQEIVWHEHLHPIILNVHGGQLYVVGIPPTDREYELYGRAEPPYIAVTYSNGRWKRIALGEIPKAIYDSNMLSETLPPSGISLLTIGRKDGREINGDPGIGRQFRRIEATYRSNFH